MGNTAEDPVDHYRTTRPHAGVTMKNTAAIPGLIFAAFGVVAFVGCLAALANQRYAWAAVCIAIAVVAAAAAATWLYAQRRRVRNVEKDWHDKHPEVVPTAPDS